MIIVSVFTEEDAKFTKNLSNVEGTETDNVKMICEVSKAGAEVTWYRGEEELPEGGRYEQIMDGRKRILIIQDLRMEDAGEYNCRLSPTVRTSATLRLSGTNTSSRPAQKKRTTSCREENNTPWCLLLLLLFLHRTCSRVHRQTSEPGGG